MKQKIMLSVAMMLISLLSFAQEKTKGFYINPNLNLSNHAAYFQGGGLGVNVTPQISIGYLWGTKNRQNITLNGLSGGLNRFYSLFGTELRYSYDYRVYKNKRLAIFVSPYAKAGINLLSAKNFSGSTSYTGTKIMNYGIQLGLSPSIEYKLGRKTDFIFSIPIHLAGFTYNHYKSVSDSSTQTYTNSSARFLHAVEANVGIRINLFNKK